jgi:hypothetical protein
VLRRRALSLYARYRSSDLCTPAELRTIEALMCEGLSLQQFRKCEGVSPAAIEARIQGLFWKAPEFYNGWRKRHRNRRRR